MVLRDDDVLNLPDAPDFVSAPPVMSLDEMIRSCEGMLVQWNKIRYAKPQPEFVGSAFVLFEPKQQPR